MRSPVHAAMAPSKFRTEPSRTAFRSNLTGKATRAANAWTTAAVSSSDASSRTTSSSGTRVCAAMLASWSGRYAAPLHVHSATEKWVSAIPRSEVRCWRRWRPRRADPNEAVQIFAAGRRAIGTPRDLERHRARHVVEHAFTALRHHAEEIAARIEDVSVDAALEPVRTRLDPCDAAE